MVTVAEAWLGHYWWVLALPVITCFAVGSVINVAFTSVSFVLLCLILPLIMMMLYFNYAITPEAAMAVRPHIIKIDIRRGIDIEFADNPDTGRTYSPVHIDWQEIDTVEYRSSDTAITFRNRNYRFLIIPYYSFDSESDIKALSEILNAAVTANNNSTL